MKRRHQNLFSPTLTVLLITLLSAPVLVKCAYAYDNIEYGFSITPPTMWLVKEDTGIPGVVIGFMKSDTSASINVVVVNATATLSQISREIESTMSQSFTDFELVYKTNKVIGGTECVEIEYLLTELGLEFKTRQVLFMSNEKQFVITYMALESEYATYLQDAESSIESFRIAGSQGNNTFDFLGNPTLPYIVAGILAVVVLVLVFYLILRRGKEPESSTAEQSSIPSMPQVFYEKPKVSTRMPCYNCGKEIPEGNFEFCPFCGKSLKA